MERAATADVSSVRSASKRDVLKQDDIPEKYDYLRKSRSATKEDDKVSERSRSRSCSQRRGRRSSFRGSSGDGVLASPGTSLMKKLQNDSDKEEEDASLLLEDSSRQSRSTRSSRTSVSRTRARQHSGSKSSEDAPLSASLGSLLKENRSENADKEDRSLLMEESSRHSRSSLRSRSRSRSRKAGGSPVKIPKSLMGPSKALDSDEEEEDVLLPGKNASPNARSKKKRKERKGSGKSKSSSKMQAHSNPDASFDQACDEFLSLSIPTELPEIISEDTKDKANEESVGDAMSASFRSSRTKRMSAGDFRKDLSQSGTLAKPVQRGNNSMEIAKVAMDAFESDKAAKKKMPAISDIGESMGRIVGRLRRHGHSSDKSARDRQAVDRSTSRMVDRSTGHRLDHLIMSSDSSGSGGVVGKESAVPFNKSKKHAHTVAV